MDNVLDEVGTRWQVTLEVPGQKHPDGPWVTGFYPTQLEAQLAARRLVPLVPGSVAHIHPLLDCEKQTWGKA